MNRQCQESGVINLQGAVRQSWQIDTVDLHGYHSGLSCEVDEPWRHTARREKPLDSEVFRKLTELGQTGTRSCTC
jgi:hypothetical protein